MEQLNITVVAVEVVVVVQLPGYLVD